MSFLLGLVAGSASGVVLGNAPVTNAIDQALYSLLPNNPKDSITNIDLYRRNQIDLATYHANMKLLGYDTANSDEILKAAEQLITANEILQFRRQAGQKAVLDFANGTLSQQSYDTEIIQIDADYQEAMQAIGFTTLEATRFRESSREVATFGTFLEWMAKEIFEPDQREKFKLDAELPDLFVKFASQFDVNTDEAKNYWAQHWNHISPDQVFEIFHRYNSDRTDVNTQSLDALGLTHDDVKMSFDDVKDYMKLIELTPYWRDRLTSITYRPFPQIMLRWGYEEGLIPQSQVVARLKDIGYSPDDSELMASIFSRRFTSGRKKNLQDNTLALFKLRSIDRATALADLENTGLTTEDANFQLDKIDDQIEEDLIQINLKRVMKQYIKGFIADSELVAAIEAETGNALRTPFILEWFEEEKEKNKPKLTTRQLQKALKNEKITEQEFSDRLEELNFSAEDIQVLVDTAEFV